MEYSFDIFNKTPERLAMVLADNCRKRRLDRGMSRRRLADLTGIPEAGATFILNADNGNNF